MAIIGKFRLAAGHQRPLIMNIYLHATHLRVFTMTSLVLDSSHTTS